MPKNLENRLLPPIWEDGIKIRSNSDLVFLQELGDIQSGLEESLWREIQRERR